MEARATCKIKIARIFKRKEIQLHLLICKLGSFYVQNLGMTRKGFMMC